MSSFLIALLFFIYINQERTTELHSVTYKQFEKFVKNTGYVTDAEKYNWSFVQKDVYHFEVVKGANWRKPDGISAPPSKNLPVTQVSYNDAIAYCKWSKTRLPSYEEYWKLLTDDQRKINTTGSIRNVADVNILGNVWEITSTIAKNTTRLAGGSIYCSKKTCNGTLIDRVLYIDTYTSNAHIGFAVITIKK